MERLRQSVLRYGGADDVAETLQRLAAVGHADRGSDSLDHRKIIHAVPESVGVLHRDPKLLADMQDTAAFVEGLRADLAVHTSVLRDILDHEVISVGQRQKKKPSHGRDNYGGWEKRKHEKTS